MALTKTKRDEPERGRSTTEDELCDMRDIALRLATKARLKGFSVGIIIVGYDPLANEAHATGDYVGNGYEIIGATREALNRWEAI